MPEKLHKTKYQTTSVTFNHTPDGWSGKNRGGERYILVWASTPWSYVHL